MKKILFTLTFFLLSAGILLQHATAQSQEKNLLWEISGNGLAEPSFLFGTIHSIAEKDFFFPNGFHEKFEQCQVLALEIDLKIPMAKQIEIMQRSMLPEGNTLAHYLDSGEFQAVKAYLLDTVGVSQTQYKQFIRMKPIISQAAIMQSTEGKTKSYEQELFTRAKSREMKIVGLETVDFQLSIFDKVSLEEQVQGFMEMVNNPQETRARFEKMNQTYIAQDIEALYALIQAESVSMEGFEDKFLTERNENWIPKIEEYAKARPTFFAVGAGHLGGEKGVISLLRKAGFAVKPVK